MDGIQRLPREIRNIILSIYEMDMRKEFVTKNGWEGILYLENDKMRGIIPRLNEDNIHIRAREIKFQYTYQDLHYQPEALSYMVDKEEREYFFKNLGRMELYYEGTWCLSRSEYKTHSELVIKDLDPL